MPVHVTFGFFATLTGDRRYSWTESRWLPNATDLDGGADDACESLASAKLGLMAGNTFLLSMRQSLFTLDANGSPIASRQRNRILIPQGSAASIAPNPIISNVKPRGAFTALNSDQPKSSVQLVLDGQISGGGAKGAGTLYLCGVPDDVILTGANAVPGSTVPNWSNRLQVYMDRLRSGGWAYLGTRKPPLVGPVPIVSWANEIAAPNRLILTTAGALGATGGTPLNEGRIIQVRKVRNAIPRTPRAVGRWRIALIAGPDTVGKFSYTLANSEAFTATDITTPGTVESVTQAFYSFLGTGTALRPTTRKRGGSYGAARGRSRPRPRQLV